MIEDAGMPITFMGHLFVVLILLSLHCYPEDSMTAQTPCALALTEPLLGPGERV
jgi:hypothetical protein